MNRLIAVSLAVINYLQNVGAYWRVMYFLTTAARLGAKIPDMNDADACRKDKYCNGLFSGCTATAPGATCHPNTTDICGPRYVDGWTGALCTPRR